MALGRPIRTLGLLAAAAMVLATMATVLAAGGRPEGRITRYEVATRGDLLLYRLVSPPMAGDVADWTSSALGGLPAQVGDWVSKFLDANTLAGLITEAFPIEGQPALGPVEALVADCSRTLGLEKPAVHVRESHLARAYSVRSGESHHLVLTSRLLDLFESRPDELRFVVGRELGHILCGHAEMRAKGYAILAAIQAVNASAVPDRFQAALPTLVLGRLFTRCRESEISADRAGLLCSGEPGPAYRAIMRLQHGLKADSPWIDPSAPDFDPEPVLRDFQEWQYRPFVRFLLDLKRQPLGHPYYQERLAALKSWAGAGAPRKILDRPDSPGPIRLIEVVRIEAFELAAEGRTADPYVVVLDGDRQVLRTPHGSGVREYAWWGFRSSGPGVDQPRGFRDGCPLFFEIWDSDYGPDSFIGGFVIYPDATGGVDDAAGGRTADFEAKILWDWKEAGAIARPGHARVRVRFHDTRGRRRPESREAGRKKMMHEGLKRAAVAAVGSALAAAGCGDPGSGQGGPPAKEPPAAVNPAPAGAATSPPAADKGTR